MLPLLLLVSFLGTCGTVFYILHTYKGERKSSISLHVAANIRAHTLFALGHFIGGLCFLVFSYKYFYVTHGSLVLLVLASIGFFVEQVQAFIPNNARFEKVHTVAASLMGVFISLIVFSAPFIIRMQPAGLVAYVSLVLVLVISGVYASFNRAIFYKTQVLFFSSFYVFLLLLLYVGKS